jgi:hypothetical protein
MRVGDDKMSMILRIKIEYSGEDKVRGWTKEQRDSMRQSIMALREIEEPKTDEYKDKEGKNCSYTVFNLAGEHLVTEQEAAWLKSNEVDFIIKDFKNTYKSQNMSDGNQYHYHLPNIGLLLINEVTWLEDACTEVLQGKLDEGFRIIAVCPPNGARRPDYILGKARD